MRAVVHARKNRQHKKKVSVVSELQLIYPLMILLKVSVLAKSVYYYTLSIADKDNKNKEIIDKIKEIFINNKEKKVEKSTQYYNKVIYFTKPNL